MQAARSPGWGYLFLRYRSAQQPVLFEKRHPAGDAGIRALDDPHAGAYRAFAAGRGWQWVRVRSMEKLRLVGAFSSSRRMRSAWSRAGYCQGGV